MIKRVLCFLVILSVSLPLCGCWNDFDLNSLAIVVGVGFDNAGDGQIEVTVEVLNPGQENQSSDTPGGGRKSTVYTVEGPTFFDAIRNFIAKVSKRLYWNDVQVVVIGETYAKGGITDILDFFQRDQQTNLNSDLIVAKGLTAKEVLEARPNIDSTTAMQIDDSLENITNFGKNINDSLFDIVKQISALKPCVVVGAIEMDNRENDTGGSGSPDGASSGSPPDRKAELADMAVQGSAILKNYKLAGYLTPNETRGFLFAEDRIRGTIITVKNPMKEGKLVAFKLTESKGKIRTAVTDGKPELTIQVDATGVIGDQQGNGDLTSFKNTGILTKEVEEEIKSEIQAAASVSQKNYTSDIFCFNKNIFQNNLDAWKKLKSKWDDIYSHTAITIQVSFLITRSGMITKPLEQR
jgi:germination protein, Ger(x)C family